MTKPPILAGDVRPQPDLVLLEVEMPGMSGFDACNRLRRMAQCAKTGSKASAAKT